MRIGVDAHRLSLQRFGIGRYIEYLLKHMVPLLESDERVLVYVREAEHAESLELSDRFEIKALPSRLDGVWWENLVLARQSHESWTQVFSPSYTIPLTFRGKTVVATHSVELRPNPALMIGATASRTASGTGSVHGEQTR